MFPKCVFLSLSITLSLFATKKIAVVILRGSCVNSVFSLTVNDNSTLPVSPSAQADTHSLLLSSPNYLPLIQIRKLKSRSSMKALRWVMREIYVCVPKCARMCTRVNPSACVHVWVHTEGLQDRIPPKALLSKESFNVRVWRTDLNQDHHKHSLLCFITWLACDKQLQRLPCTVIERNTDFIGIQCKG